MNKCFKVLRSLALSAVVASTVMFAGSSVAQAEAVAGADPIVIKLATSVPTGSMWFKELTSIKNVVEKLTEGRVQIKIFAGSVLGDDKQVLDKMKYGQVQAAAFTGVGLGEIVPMVRLMELPFNFENGKQIDCVLSKMLPTFNAKFDAAGYVNLGWAEQGLIFLFSAKEIKTPADMNKTKPWVWGADPLARAIFEVFGIKPVPLALQDVYMSLQSGIIDTVYISPAAVTGLGWHQKAPNMFNVPVTNGAGAILIKKDVWEKIIPADRDVIQKTSDKVFGRLINKSREENLKAIDVLKEKGGVKVFEVPAADKAGFTKKGAETADRLIGKLYTKEELETFRAAVKACR
jgi:TRAP-type C4-dicarboxylate transport system substrate-binding protein